MRCQRRQARPAGGGRRPERPGGNARPARGRRSRALRERIRRRRPRDRSPRSAAGAATRPAWQRSSRAALASRFRAGAAHSGGPEGGPRPPGPPGGAAPPAGAAPREPSLFGHLWTRSGEHRSDHLSGAADLRSDDLLDLAAPPQQLFLVASEARGKGLLLSRQGVGEVPYQRLSRLLQPPVDGVEEDRALSFETLAHLGPEVLF